MMAITGKLQFMLPENYKSSRLEIRNTKPKSTNLVINLVFNLHILNVCEAAGVETKSFSRITNSLEEKYARLLYNYFF